MHSSKERRWAAIAQDGRHVWLGRATDPTVDELADVIRQLDAKGAVAWLAVTEGVYHGSGDLKVMMVRPLSGSGSWEAAVAAFLAIRKRNLADIG